MEVAQDSEANVSSGSPSSNRIEDCGLCMVYIQKSGAAPLVGARERQKKNRKK